MSDARLVLSTSMCSMGFVNELISIIIEYLSTHQCDIQYAKSYYCDWTLQSQTSLWGYRLHFESRSNASVMIGVGNEYGMQKDVGIDINRHGRMVLYHNHQPHITSKSTDMFTVDDFRALTKEESMFSPANGMTCLVCGGTMFVTCFLDCECANCAEKLPFTGATGEHGPIGSPSDHKDIGYIEKESNIITVIMNVDLIREIVVWKFPTLTVQCHVPNLCSYHAVVKPTRVECTIRHPPDPFCIV